MVFCKYRGLMPFLHALKWLKEHTKKHQNPRPIRKRAEPMAKKEYLLKIKKYVRLNNKDVTRSKQMSQWSRKRVRVLTSRE